MQGKRAVVLGGAGFLGSWLCERLLADGADKVLAVDNLITGAERNVEGLRKDPRFVFLRHDICEPLLLDGPWHYVFNLASPASPVHYLEHWLETMRVGSVGTENGLHFARKHQAVFLQASTSEIYGDPLVHPQDESYQGNVSCTGPRAVYDEAKRYGEALVSGFARNLGVETRIVRIFNTYGPRMQLNDGRVVPAFVAQVLEGKDFTVFGDGSQTRSFCYCEDLIDGIVRLALSGVKEPVNIGNPREMTILEFARAVMKAAGSDGKIEFQPLPKDDPKQRQPDITRARTLLGWEPKVSLEEGLPRTIAYFRGVLKR